MYIATCAFDKTISIFDFFSGELVTQVSGHSDLVTGVKFSPDGRYLVSIGGDGCILMWRVAEFLVKAMQDRLVELMTSAQRQNLKAAVAVRKSHSESVVSTSGGSGKGSNYSPPPPLPTPSYGLPPAPPNAEQLASVSASNNSVDTQGAPKKRWAVKEEYTILNSKKIDPAETPHRNKFTLELDNTTRAGLLAVAESDRATVGIDSPARMAEVLEAGDDVMLSDEEDEGDGSHLFKPEAANSVEDPLSPSDDYESDFEDVAKDASTHDAGEEEGVESPEGKRNAAQLGNWLEDQVLIAMHGQFNACDFHC